MLLEDALDDAYSHEQLMARFDTTEAEAKEAYEAAAEAVIRARRSAGVGRDVGATEAQRAAAAPELARRALDLAIDVERATEHLGSGSARMSVTVDPDNESYGRADTLTQRAATTCDLPHEQLARR